ncbi:MAG: hypothetical protein ACRCV5_06165, partial [Afipia sp.]
MLKNFYLVTLLILGSTFVGAANYIMGDTIRSPDRTKTWQLPATSGTLVKSTDNIATATALAANPADCASDRYATTIAANGDLTCAQVTNDGLAGSIAASKLVGTDIATVGTVTAGTWQGTAISPTYGGTGQNSSAASGIPHVASGTWSFPAYVQIAEQSTPATPASGNGRIYFKSDGKLYQLNDDGAESAVGAGGSTTNLLENPGWESNTNDWTASGGTYTRTTTTANVGSGAGAGSWDSNSASQTLTADSITIPSGYYGAWGVASCRFKSASGTATHKIQAYDGTNVLAEQTITSDTVNYPRTSVNFAFPGSGSITMRVISVASNEPTVYIDDCYLGLSEGFNTANVSQVTLWVKATWPYAAGCNWATTSTSLASFSADTDCSNPTIVGYGTAAGTKIPGFVLTSMPRGKYLVVFSGAPYATASTNANAYFRVTDGTNNSASCLAASGGTIAGSGGCSFTLDTTTDQSNVTLQLQAATSGSGGTPTVNLYVDGSATQASGGLIIAVYRFPDASEAAIQLDQTGWFVDANISGTSPDLGTSDVSTYVEMGSSALTMVQNTGSTSVQSPCSGTNPSTGLTCSAGNEGIGVVFSIPRAGVYKACVEFSHYGAVSATSSVNTAFQIMETPNNAQTIT